MALVTTEAVRTKEPVLQLGPDDLIETLTDFLFKRLALFHRRDVIVGISFFLHLEKASTRLQRLLSDLLTGPRC